MRAMQWSGLESHDRMNEKQIIIYIGGGSSRARSSNASQAIPSRSILKGTVQQLLRMLEKPILEVPKVFEVPYSVTAQPS